MFDFGVLFIAVLIYCAIPNARPDDGVSSVEVAVCELAESDYSACCIDDNDEGISETENISPVHRDLEDKV